jgi:hypothetical protein
LERLSLAELECLDSKGVIKNLLGFRACNFQHFSLASGRVVFSSCGADPSRAKKRLSAPTARGPSGKPRCMVHGAAGRMGPHGVAWGRVGLHGAAWGRTGPHRAAWGLAWGSSRTLKRKKRRAAGCYLLRWRWANNPLALPSKYPIPADLFITDPTCSIAGHD